MFASTGKRAEGVKWGDNETIIIAYPDISKVRPARLQKAKRKIFADSVGYAYKINNDLAKKALYVKKVKKGQPGYKLCY